ncbi:hypothetical protein HKCCE2091_10520 [Rhodobacterales bacterium HKCCE2091]|nr:hypothetical protein [Rhodobacterales bacterium HKCCE2091]
MDDSPDDAPALPPDLRFLKGLVTVLTAVMILGVITVAALLVIRLNDDPPPMVISPGDYAVPDGVAVTGYSIADGHVILTGDDGVIRVYDAETGTLTREIGLGD